MASIDIRFIGVMSSREVNSSMRFLNTSCDGSVLPHEKGGNTANVGSSVSALRLKS